MKESTGRRRWLLFLHQLPAQPSNLRVSTWRRLQRIGAIPLKQGVYALPDTADAREDLEWLKTDVKAAGGEAAVFAGENVDAWSDDALVEEFRRARQSAYDELASEVEQAIKQAGRPRRPRGVRAPALRRLVDMFLARLDAIEKIDFFGSAGRDGVLAAIRRLEERIASSGQPSAAAASPGDGSKASFERRVWVTRPRPGVDRMASAWLIRRFIDAQAQFAFAADRGSVPAQAIPFDMFGVEFSHHGEQCTFETLCTAFSLQHAALSRLAAIVHDLDLKDGKFGAPESATVAALIEGLQLAHATDHELLEQGMTLFESLYRSFEQAGRSSGPRLAARAKPRRRTSTASTRRTKGRGK